MEAERSRLALESDFALAIDQVKPIRPAGVLLLGCVFHAVHDRRELDPKFAHATAGNVLAFIGGLRGCEQYVVANVALHLPNVGGMRLKNVNGKERNLILVTLGELVEGGNLPPERRSCIAAED